MTPGTTRETSASSAATPKKKENPKPPLAAPPPPPGAAVEGIGGVGSGIPPVMPRTRAGYPLDDS